ncbi:hypothetical protein VP01_85g1 [Puccinia sorghi]|uniref:Tc1-like transposase DDE domain-containing protein n=1 Tax=Puccinia sorghi TaxID=27349 RepID=A0A0L6U905_9BASI|nr:hypothetical protein VP01_85g1 [Puccinia sorghi]
MRACFVIEIYSGYRIILLPAISMGGLLALTTTMETYQQPKFGWFLEFDLIPRMSPYPGKNSVLVCNNSTIHQAPHPTDLPVGQNPLGLLV